MTVPSGVNWILQRLKKKELLLELREEERRTQLVGALVDGWVAIQ